MQNFKSYNSNNFTWFVLVGEGVDKINRGGSVSFRGYTDHADAHGKGAGAYIQYVTSKDEKGRDVGKYFTMDESRRRFQVRTGERDINQITQYDFLRYSPDCENSPNGVYTEAEGLKLQQGVMFRELNTDKDAETALDAERIRTRAQDSALKLDDNTLQELAAHIGVFGNPGSSMQLRVFEWAGKRPGDYFRVLESGDRALRAIVRKALADGVFNQKGTVIYWENTLVGGDEDEAVRMLMREPKMLDVLQKKVDLKTEVKVKSPSKGGRPAGSKNKPKDEAKQGNTEKPEKPAATAESTL